MAIKTLVVDGRALIRAGIRHACTQDDQIELIGEAHSWTEAESMIHRDAPDVIMIDLSQFRQCSDQLSALIGDHHPAMRILVFGESEQFSEAIDSINSGASGYLTEVADLSEITVGIRCVHAGRVFISHSNTDVRPPKMLVHTRQDSEALSEREQEVVEWLARGLTNKQVAEKLFLSVKTIETYRARIMKKNQLKDRSEMMQFARRFTQWQTS